MKAIRIAFVSAIVLGLMFGQPAAHLLSQAAPQAMQVWVAHIADKIQPTTAPGTANSISLEGARASYAAAQIIVHAGGEALSGVNITAGVLSDGHGHTIPAANITFYRQSFINFTGVEEAEPGSMPVPENSPTHDPWLPDPLIPFIDPYDGGPAGAPFAVDANRNQPVWADFLIPENALPGTYTGQITVSATGQPAVNVPVSLTVWNLLLPDKNTVTTYFQAHFGQVINYHRNTYEGSPNPWLKYDAYTRQLVKRYEELIHVHRLDTWMEFIPPPEASGQCAVPSDWSSYDAAVQPYMDGSYWSDGVPNKWIVVPFSPGVTWGIEESCSQAEYTALAAGWAAHLKTKGWFDNAIAYAYDEPPESVYPDIARHSSWMQAGDPGWKAHIMDTTEPNPGNVGVLNPALGIYTVCLRCYDHWYQGQDTYGRAEWPQLFNQGIQLWFYESNAQSDPYPTFATNTLWGVEPLITLWGSWYEKASGFLYWDVMAWNDNAASGGPWGPNVDYGKTGDGVLLYPGNHDGFLAPMGSPNDITIDGPIPSYRLKLIRAGLQDWALFQLAEQRGIGDYARQQVARVYGQFGGCDWQGCPEPVNGEFYWKASPALMDEVRHNVAMRLSVNTAPHTPANPHPANGATNAFTNEILSWQGGDPNGDPVTYTVALGAVNPPPITATVSSTAYAPTLAANTHYYWQITATDGLSSTVGALWQFTTGEISARRIYLPLLRR
ncbi:MAG: glycoside hydrolase domain-containing protein [Chloroflexota bacterium]